MKAWAARAAIRAAKRSTYVGYMHGAVFERGGRLIGTAQNRLRPSNPQTACSIHAEVALLSQVVNFGSLLKGSFSQKKKLDIYVARLSKGKVGLSKPCHKCMAALRKSGIVRRVFYSVAPTEWECEVI